LFDFCWGGGGDRTEPLGHGQQHAAHPDFPGMKAAVHERKS
jgi:hypothetical protein